MGVEFHIYSVHRSSNFILWFTLMYWLQVMLCVIYILIVLWCLFTYFVLLFNVCVFIYISTLVLSSLYAGHEQ